ncbi:hypothetical protein GCM10022228_11220 [Halomonas cibimaris]|uniref:Uncharacterized protein n=1 Tax=Halomonas cibimaris TaxID=657012 RepID=A0ABP7LMG3_9GAMM
MEFTLNLPVFIWEAVANFASILLAGLIIAFVTTFYLKKKDERTRVAGVILEKRVDAQQEILRFMESSTQKFEVRQNEASLLRELLLKLDMHLPYDPHVQYADIFTSTKKFREFAHGVQGFEGLLEKHKLWLDVKVRRHILTMQAYFASINALLISFNRVPLPKNITLSEKDFTELSDRLLWMLGAVLDEEFNRLVMDLEVLLVGSIYKLDLTRPKAGIFAKRHAGKEIKRVENFLYEKSLLGAYIRQAPILVILLLQAHKNIEISEEEAMDYYMRVTGTSVTDKPRVFM